MAIFDAGSAAYQGPTSVGGTAVLIWSGTATALAAVTPAVTLRDITVQNVGSFTCYVGGSSVTTAAMPVPAGAQLTIQGWTATSNKTTNDVFAITTSGATATSVIASLASNAWVV